LRIHGDKAHPELAMPEKQLFSTGHKRGKRADQRIATSITFDRRNTLDRLNRAGKKTVAALNAALRINRDLP